MSSIEDDLTTATPAPEPPSAYVDKTSISGVIRSIPRRATVKAERILIAEDDAVSRTVLERCLTGWGHELTICHDGTEAWEYLQREDCPTLAILDWIMPGIEGPELCRRARALAKPVPTYMILLTGKGSSENIVAGLESGADDYVTKPFDRAELRSRIRVGERVIELERGLANRVQELETALSHVKQLTGLLPICAYCKNVRDDKNYWQRVETYIVAHSNARFTHGVCPDCWKAAVEQETSDCKHS